VISSVSATANGICGKPRLNNFTDPEFSELSSMFLTLTSCCNRLFIIVDYHQHATLVSNPLVSENITK